MIQGPFVKKLIVHRMSQLMVPHGCKDAFGTAVRALMDKGTIIRCARDATEWVEMALRLVRTAPDNPYESDEEIAAAILVKIDERLGS